MTEILNQREVQAFIDHRFGDRASGVTRLSGGDWSQAYALSLDGTQVVARFGSHGEDYKKDRVASGWASDELPIPEIVELDETEVGFFALSVGARGLFLDELREDQIRVVLPGLFRTMDAIRDIDVSATEGYGNWESDGHGPQGTWREALLDKFEGDPPTHRTHGWRAALETSPGGTRDFDAALKVFGRLAEHMPTERHVIHNDLLNRNVLVQGDRISAVLDWGNAMYGDPLYDAAWLLYCQPRYTSWPELDLAGQLRRHWEASGSVPEDLKARLLCYQIHVGLDAQAYAAYKRNWDELRLNTEQTMELVEAVGGVF